MGVEVREAAHGAHAGASGRLREFLLVVTAAGCAPAAGQRGGRKARSCGNGGGVADGLGEQALGAGVPDRTRISGAHGAFVYALRAKVEAALAQGPAPAEPT